MGGIVTATPAAAQRRDLFRRALKRLGGLAQGPLSRRANRRGDAGQDGFILLESIISIGLVSVIMASLTTLFISTGTTTNHLRLRQEAIQLAESALEQVRDYAPNALVTGRDTQSVTQQFATAPAGVTGVLATMVKEFDLTAPATSSSSTCVNVTPSSSYLPTSPVCQTVGSRTFSVSYYLGNCYAPTSGSGGCIQTVPAQNAPYVTYQRVVVGVAWANDHCNGSGSCYYTTSTLVDDNTDPAFNVIHPGTPSPAIIWTPSLSNVGDTGPFTPPTVQAGYGVAPFTWSASTATGLPPGLTMAADGSISGTIGDTGAASVTYPVTVTVVDGAIQTASGTFNWTVIRPTIITPANQDTLIKTPVTLPVTAFCPKTPCTFSMTNAPVGLSIDNNGLITGTPTVAGTVAMTVTVTDANGVKATTNPFKWAVLQPATVCVPEIALANGSFEGPEVSHGAPNWLVGGSSPLLWDTTEPDNVIELWKNDGAGNQTGLTAQNANSGMAISAEDGTQWAELNANQTGALYQDLPTVPGQILQWSVWHRGRYSGAANASKKDIMQVQIGSTTVQGVQVPTGQTSPDIADGPNAWALYRGVYTVPAGQTLTRFQFAAVSTASGNDSIGNFIDNLSLNNYVACLNQAPADQTSTVGTAIPSLQLSASRGSGQFAWTVLYNSLPAGLTMSSDGLISGTPTSTGTSPVVIKLSDLQTGFEQSIQFNWTVVAKPTITAPPTQTTSVGGTVNLPLTTTCLNVPCSYAMNGGPAGLTISNTGVVTGTVTSAAQTFTGASITVRDNEGVTATSAAFSWVINPAPTMSNPGDRKTLRGSTVNVSVASYASGGTGTFNFSATGLPSWLSISSNGVITGTAPTSADSVTSGITVTATDSTSAVATSTPFSWTVYAAPTVTSPGNQASSLGTMVNLPLSSTCPNSPCSFTLTGAPTGLTISNTGTISGTVGGTIKTWTGVSVTITDAGGAATTSALFTWVVNPAPRLLSPGNQSTLHGAKVSLAMATYASGGTGTYTYTAANLPTWLTINATTGVISGTAPTGTDVTTPNITVTLTDATNVASTTAAFSWTVNNILANSIASQTAYKGSKISLDLDDYTTGGTGPYTYTATGLPSWVSLNGATGVLSGTAPTVAANTTTKTTGIVVTVTDSLGNVAKSSGFTWYLTDLIWTGVAANGSSFSTAHGTSAAGNASTYNSGGSGTKTYTAINLPTGVSVSSAGVISGTASTPGTWHCTLSVTDGVGATSTSLITWTIT